MSLALSSFATLTLTSLLPKAATSRFLLTDIVESSFDDCGPVTLRLTTPADDTGTPPATTSVTIPPAIGTYYVIAYAIDPSGNWSNCFSEVNIIGVNDGDCSDDNESPEILCINVLVAALSASTVTATIFAQDIIQSFTENCDTSPDFSINLVSESTGAPQNEIDITFNAAAEYPVEVWAVDDAGNATFCTTYVEIIEVTDDPCDNDEELPVPICENGLTLSAIPDFGVILWAQDID